MTAAARSRRADLRAEAREAVASWRHSRDLVLTVAMRVDRYHRDVLAEQYRRLMRDVRFFSLRLHCRPRWRRRSSKRTWPARQEMNDGMN
jgi:hypothetical protein